MKMDMSERMETDGIVINNNDYTHFIVEFGPVKTSELPSSV